MVRKFTPSVRLKDTDVTDETVYRERRTLLRSMGFIGAAALLSPRSHALSLFSQDKNGPPPANLTYASASQSEQQTLTPYQKVISYNNFYEFGTSKDSPVEAARNFRVNPWTLQVDGLVEKTITLDFDDLHKRFALQERIYRMRCVEAWSMVIPWIGFELAQLLKLARPLSSARYVAFTSLYDPEQMPGQRSHYVGGGLEYPYVEGLRLDEALHPLTLLSVGLYGHTLPAQNGAPVRLVVPWKYGFKGIKSIVRISLTDTQPPNTWNLQAPGEYGFFANVNPNVDHPRWSQKQERRITRGGLFANNMIATELFNGYQEVAPLYKNMDLRRNF